MLQPKGEPAHFKEYFINRPYYVITVQSSTISSLYLVLESIFWPAKTKRIVARLPLGYDKAEVLDPLKDSMQKKSLVEPVLQLAVCDLRRMLQPRHKHEQ